ncbi:MAG: hypothetical protein N2Z72_03540 [Bacteroidales bacterium]|nr:hypothetical protein [Bacteroidales bacterium]
MKKTFFYIFLSIILLILSGQTGIIVYEENFLPERPHLEIKDFALDQNSNIYVLANAYDINFKNPYPWVACIDAKNGSIIQEAFPLRESTKEVSYIFITPSKKVIIYGNCTRNDKLQPLFLCLDENFQINTHFIVSLKNPQIISAVVPFSRDKNLIAQNIVDMEKGKIKIGLIKTSMDMYVPTSFTYLESDHHLFASDITYSKNNKIILAAYDDDGNGNIKPIIYCLDTTGKIDWTYYPSYDPNFNQQIVQVDNHNNIYLLANYKNEKVGKCSSTLLKLNNQGKKIREKVIDGYKFNGMTILKNGKILLYGMSYQIIDNRYLVSTGTYIIINDNLEPTYAKSIGIEDLNNQNLKASIINSNKFISSELYEGMELPDGRIVLGGRFYKPDLSSDNYFNRGMILFLNKDGKF